jgi:hypothetical protein
VVARSQGVFRLAGGNDENLQGDLGGDGRAEDHCVVHEVGYARRAHGCEWDEVRGGVGDCAGRRGGSGSRSIGVVAAAVGEHVAVASKFELDPAKFTVVGGVGWCVSEGLVVGSGFDGLNDGVGKAVCVEKSMPARLFGHLEHGGVIVSCLANRLRKVLTKSARVKSLVILYARVLHGIHGWPGEASGVDWIDGHLTARKQVGGLTKLIRGVCGDREWIEEGAVGEDANRKGAREPDEVLSSWQASEIAGELIESIKGESGAKLKVVR